MKLLMHIRQGLGLKLFLSYLIVIAAGVVTLIFAAQLSTPGALARHAQRMAEVLPSMGNNQSLLEDLNDSFVVAVNQILFIATAAALLTALAVSTFVTRRLVGPIQRMRDASQRIAAGEYEEQVEVSSEDELGALANAFNQMARTLAQTEERRRRLVGDVAHELRTPLANIKGTMEGLTDGVLSADPNTFHLVEREVTRLQRLVEDLEALSRAEAGQLLLERERVNAAAFIGAAAERLRLQYQEKGVNFELQLSPRLPDVFVDEWRMTQVMINLLGNSLQYTPSGGRVEVSAERQTDQLLIRVSDTGIGIAPEHLPHLFERFYRVDKSRSRSGGGSGIGLTIARYLIEAHGGRIWAESAGLGQGSTFILTLPLAR